LRTLLPLFWYQRSSNAAVDVKRRFQLYKFLENSLNCSAYDWYGICPVFCSKEKKFYYFIVFRFLKNNKIRETAIPPSATCSSSDNALHQ